VLVAAGLAHGAREAVGVQAALELAPELVLHVLRQALARGVVHVLQEALQVLLNDTVEDGPFGAALPIRSRLA